MNKLTNEMENVTAVLVGVRMSDNDDTEILLDELERLADTAGVEVKARMIQARSTPDAATFIGSGKLSELKNICLINEIGLVIFNDELSPSQIKNLEDALGETRVIDRSMLILDIFALHAKSAEGKLQVELAQLQYTSPRLIGKGTEMSRQQGGNIAMRGPGETKLETDRRHLKRRMALLREQLSELEKNRDMQRKKREKSRIKQIAICGYTNAGKSTLLNYLTGAGILAEDMLFATLDTTTRKYTLPCGEEILLTDTVGFIRQLPHHLIEAFKSTLDEVRYADAILVVIDASDGDYTAQAQVTRQLLTELGTADKPVIYAFNKCDRPAMTIPTLTDIPMSDTVYISAKTGQGTEKLIDKLQSIALDGRSIIKVRIPNSDAGVLNTAYSLGTVRDTDYGNEFITATVIADARCRAVLEKYTVK